MKSALILFFLLPAVLTMGLSEQLPRLSPEEHAVLRSGRLIMKKRPVQGAPWPELTFFALIDASPKESAAVFSNYPGQLHYTPDLMEARPLKHVTPTDVHVLFKWDMPWPVANTETVTGNRLSRLGEKGYQVEWYLVRSDSSKESRGTARFYPYDGGKTLYRYVSFNHPTSSLSRIVKGKMIRTTRESVLGFVAYAEKVKKEKPGLMKRCLSMMNRAFNGENIYREFMD